jgi:hypothetical protein
VIKWVFYFRGFKPSKFVIIFKPGVPLIGLTQSHCFPVRSRELDFHSQMRSVLSSIWSETEDVVSFVDIVRIVDHHSMSLSERWCLLILVELLIITQWVEMRGDFCWYWWNCWPSLNELIKITSHLNSLSEGQQFHQYQQQSPLTSTHWVMVNNSTNISKHHLSP